MTTAFAPITEEFGNDAGAIRVLVSRFSDPQQSEPRVRIAAVNSATLLLAATFEEFVRQMAQAYAKTVVASVKSVEKLPPILAKTAWRRTMERLARNEIDSGAGVISAKDMLSARTQFNVVYEFCNGDLSQDIYDVLIHNENNMRPPQINRLFKAIGLVDVCSKIADKEPLLTNFGEDDRYKAHGRLMDSLNEFFDRRNTIAHSLDAVQSSSPDQILKDIDLLNAFGKSLCKTLEDCGSRPGTKT